MQGPLFSSLPCGSSFLNSNGHARTTPPSARIAESGRFGIIVSLTHFLMRNIVSGARDFTHALLAGQPLGRHYASMRSPRLFKLRTLLAGSLALAVCCASLRHVEETPSPRVKPSPRGRVAEQPLRNMAAELAKHPPSERSAALDRLLQRSAHSLTAADAEWFLEMQSRAAEEGWQVTRAQWHQFLQHWASRHPRDAAEFLETHGMLAPPAADAVPVLQAWARGDAASILDWVRAGGDDRKSWWANSQHTFATAWANHDAAAAMAWVDAGGSEGMEQSIVAIVFAAAQPEAIAAWLMAHSAPDARISPSARSVAVRSLANLHLKNAGPEAALRWAKSLVRNDEESAAAAAILPALTAAAPAQALAWLEGLSTRRLATPEQSKTAMITWASADAEAAGEWLNAHRDSSAAPAFIEGYAMSIAGDDPAAARQWIAHLPETSVPAHQYRVMNFGGEVSGRSELEHIVRLGEISILALDDPEKAIKLAGELPAVGLSNYMFKLVREVPGEKPVPRFTALSPFG